MASSAEKRYVHFHETSYSYETVLHLFFIIEKINVNKIDKSFQY